MILFKGSDHPYRHTSHLALSHSRHHNHRAHNQPTRQISMIDNDMNSPRALPQRANLQLTATADVHCGSTLKWMSSVEHIIIPDKHVSMSCRAPTTIGPRLGLCQMAGPTSSKTHSAQSSCQQIHASFFYSVLLLIFSSFTCFRYGVEGITTVMPTMLYCPS